MLGRKKKPMWAPQLDALPSEEQSAAMVAVYFLKLTGSRLKKAKVLPEKDPMQFEALVARVAVPFLGPAEEQEPRNLFEIAHCLRDGATVLSGSELTRGPYGDLFYRVDQGCSAIVHMLYAQRVGSQLMIDPANTVEPPKLRLFLNSMASRFADALLDQPTGTSGDGDVLEILSRLAALPTEPHLIAALRDKEPLALLAHGPDWFLSEGDILDMTRDEQLARSLGRATPL